MDTFSAVCIRNVCPNSEPRRSGRRFVSDRVHVTKHSNMAEIERICASARLDRPHKMSLMLTWLWRPRVWRGLRAVAFCGPIPPQPHSSSRSGPDTNKRIRSPCFRQTLHSRQSFEQLSVTLNDKSANLCQSLWAGIPVFGG